MIIDEMDKKTAKYVISRLRDASLKCDNRNEVVRRAKVKDPIGKNKDGTTKYKVKLRCAECKELYLEEFTEVDHIIEVGGFEGDWTSFINRLFCNIENLRVVCKICHNSKTNLFMKLKRKLELF